MINLFNAQVYMRQNPDVAEAVEQGYLTAQQHFDLYGQAEGRSPGPLFNVDYYLASNPDVVAVAGENKGIAYIHFLNYGLTEGRSSVPFFDPEFYLSQNPDVAQAIHEGWGTAIQHFLTYGLNEPRQISVSLNLKDYLAANPDVAQAVNEGHAEALPHLLVYGVTEGRDLGNGISLKDFANDPTFIDALAKGDTSAALARVDKIAPFMPDFKAPTNWELAVGTELPADFVPVEGKYLVIPSGFDIDKEGLSLPPAFKKPDDVKPPVVPKDEESKAEKPVDPEVSEPESPDPVVPNVPGENVESALFAEWALVLPMWESLFLYHQGKMSAVSYEMEGGVSLEYVESSLNHDKVLYKQNFSSTHGVSGKTTYQGELYMFDPKEGLENVGGYDGSDIKSPNGDILFLGNKSMVFDANLQVYTPSSMAMPTISSEIIWNEDASQVWFLTTSAPYGEELYSYTLNPDLSMEGGLVRDIFPGSGSGVDSYYFKKGFALLPNNQAFFYANGNSYNEFWISDGIETNTKKLDFLNDYKVYSAHESPIKNFQNKVVFSARKHNDDYSSSYGLVMTEGTEEQTFFLELNEASSIPEILWVTDDSLFFSVSAETTKIFKTDIEGNYEELAEVGSISFLGHNEEKAFIGIHDDIHGKELWLIDAKTGKTQLVKDILPGSGSSIAGNQESIMVNDKLLFSAYTSAMKQQFFVSDGTEAGTVALSDGPAQHLLTVDNYIFYSEGGRLYTANLDLQVPVPTLITDKFSGFGMDLQYDQDQLFFKTVNENQAVYSYHWESGTLEKIMDSVNIFSVIDENLVFGLAADTYSYDEETGHVRYEPMLEWFLSDGTSAGTESVQITFPSDSPSSHGLYHVVNNAALVRSSIDLVGEFSTEIDTVL